MLFKELVEQHRVHRFVVHCLNLAFGVAAHKIGIYLCHFLGHKAESQHRSGIHLLLVAEGNWFERQDRLAHFVHGFDLRLETGRGDADAKLAIGVYKDWIGAEPYSKDAGNKGSCLGSSRADADNAGLTSMTDVTDIDVVKVRGVIGASSGTQRNVAAAGVVQERISTNGRVVCSGGVARERQNTIRCIIPASGITKKSARACSSIAAARGVENERTTTHGCVTVTGGIITERINTIGSVGVAGGVVTERLKTGGRVEATRGVDKEGKRSIGRV